MGQELGAPGAQGAAESGDLGDRAGVQSLEQRLGLAASLVEVVGVVDPRSRCAACHATVTSPSGSPVSNARVQPGDVLVGEVLAAPQQQPPDGEQRVAGVTAMTQCVLLDSAADLVDDGVAELDRSEGNPGQHGLSGVAPRSLFRGSADLSACTKLDCAPEIPGVALNASPPPTHARARLSARGHWEHRTADPTTPAATGAPLDDGQANSSDS